MSTSAVSTGQSEGAILLRVFENEQGQISPELAREILNFKFSDRDKARLHDLLLRNQNDELTPEEKEEMFAFVKAGDLLAILKSKARRTLGIKFERRITP